MRYPEALLVDLRFGTFTVLGPVYRRDVVSRRA